MALCTKEQVKIHMFGSSSGTTFDTLLDQIIGQVESLIEHETGIKAVATDYDAITDEIVNGTGETVVKVKYKPVRAVTKIEYRDGDWSFEEYDTAQQAYADMELGDWKIYTKYVTIPKGHRTGRVSYTAGYKTAETPDDLNQCAVLLTSNLFNHRNSIGFNNQTSLGISIGLSNEDSLFVTRTLTKYKKINAFG